MTPKEVNERILTWQIEGIVLKNLMNMDRIMNHERILDS